jgi:acyl-[acyl-carrier-protein]-phospholipid O-acyltransferase/long-chain-fatty-acid--[acyl-carrier-protein] ligase
MLADRIPVFLNFTASREALAHAMNQCGMSRVWTVRPFMEKIGLELDCETVYIDEWCKTISATDRLRAVAAACLMKKETIRGRFLRESSRSLDNTATVLFSSGSTGVPKGVVLSHHNLNANLNGVIRVLCLERRDVIMGILPFFHSFGFLATFWLPVKCGVKVVYHSNPVDADAIGEMVQRHRATILFSTPTFLQAYIRKCTREQFASLRLIITGAEKLRTAIAQKFTEKFGPFPVEGYGCTELSPVVSVNVPLLGQDAGKLCGREGSVGQPMPGVTVKTVSPDSGEILDEEEEGLLLIKGPNVMQGYLEDPDRTAEVLKDGWYNTGDIGKIDRDGYIFITGRLSRFSKIAGEMIPHGAVEEEIHSVLDCKETLAVVTSVSDEKKGEKLVVLHLPLEKSVDDIISGLREKGLPNLWIPKVRDFHEIEEIPVLGTGKLDLKKVSELAKKLAQ